MDEENLLSDWFDSCRTELQAAAAKGLGDLGNTHNDATVVPPLLEMLDAPGVDIRVQTEVAWALGRVPDRRSVQPLFDLDIAVNSHRSSRSFDKKSERSGLLVDQTGIYGRSVQLVGSMYVAYIVMSRN